MAEKRTSNNSRDECMELRQRGSQLLRSGAWADCTFLVGEDREPVRAHRLLLAMASPVFEAMFYGAMPPKNEDIPVPDIEVEGFRNLLQYIYTDEIQFSPSVDTSELYHAAHKYWVLQLLRQCSLRLWKDLTVQNACYVFEMAALYGDTNLVNMALQVFIKRTNDVLSHSGFLDAQVSTVVAIFSLNTLNIESECDLFCALERYARARRRRMRNGSKDTSCNGLECSNGDLQQTQETKCMENGDNTDTEREVLLPALQAIRFLTMSPYQFVKFCSDSSLLTHEQCAALSKNISSPQTSLPLPPGFSPIRISREKYQRPRVIFRALVPTHVTQPFYSPTFKAIKLPWRIHTSVETVRSADGAEKEYLGIFLQCNWEEKEAEWWCRCDYEMKLFHADDSVRENGVVFESKAYSWGRSDYVEWSHVLDPANRLLNENQTLTVQFVVIPDEVHTLKPDDIELTINTGHWRDECMELRLRGSELLHSGTWADCTFLVGEDQEPVSAHRLLLAMASPVFEAMCRAGDQLLIPDVTLEIFHILLIYMYTDDLTKCTWSNYREFFAAAHRYSIDGLMRKASSQLLPTLTPQLACTAYELGVLYVLPSLKKAAERLITSETLQVLASEDFLEVAPATALALFSFEVLNIDSELDLIYAAKRYLRAREDSKELPARHREVKPAKMECNTQNGDTTLTCGKGSEITLKQCTSHDSFGDGTSDMVVADDVKEIKDAMLKKIRFLTMTREVVLCGTMVSEEQLRAIVANIASAASAPMPDGFSTSRTRRNRQGLF